MKILWANLNLLHPTTKGGQIRTLEMLRILNRRHEIHYVSFEDPDQPEGIRRSGEYCSHLHVLPRRLIAKNSPEFLAQVVGGLFSSVPVAVSRFHSAEMSRLVKNLILQERFDRMVCDFLAAASHFPDVSECILFQHNVETAIWRRHTEHSSDPLRKLYFRLQARKMFAYESKVCRAVKHIVAVSAVDAELMQKLFGVSNVSEIPTGVDIEFFLPPPAAPHVADLVFLGSMDWLPNIHGVRFFVNEVLPLIRRRRPGCSLVIAGRRPPEEITAMARTDSKIFVTGTVPDIRPYLWGSSVSIVPLYIGGGTRLKIYEAMAARIPVVSTSIGAEGLLVNPPENIYLADSPEEFAGRCLELLDDAAERSRMASAAWELVSNRFSWEQVTNRFERILEAAPATSYGSKEPLLK